jgi:hypothetical protein
MHTSMSPGTLRQPIGVPLGGGVGKIFHLGRLPVNTQLSAYYNVVHPRQRADLADPVPGAAAVPEIE